MNKEIQSGKFQNNNNIFVYNFEFHHSEFPHSQGKRLGISKFFLYRDFSSLRQNSATK